MSGPEMKSADHWRQVLAEVHQAGLCARPIRLRGITLDRSSGELVEGGILVPCKDRRAAVCPSCSRLYQADAWQLVAAGIRGGKGVDPAVVEHPQLFVTFTAPSFGPVHTRSRTEARPCRPRRGGALCPHGVALSCMVRHGEDDPVLGQALCPSCFDYRGAVLWNAHVPRLWERTSLELYRAVARTGQMTDKEVRAAARLSYMKVVEFQRRGLVHLHVVIRADGREGPGEPPPAWLDAEVLSRAIQETIGRAFVRVPPTAGTSLTKASWGPEHDIRVLVPTGGGDSTAIAAYVAKYATKTADGTAWLAHPVRSAGQLERLKLGPHTGFLVRLAWQLGHRRELRALNLRAHAHTLGYTGQFSSKSLLYSTTFGALREARVRYVNGEPTDAPDGGGASDYEGQWRYAGRGYAHPEAEQLAESLLDAVQRRPRIVPRGSTSSSKTP
jgi:hypothetical protein